MARPGWGTPRAPVPPRRRAKDRLTAKRAAGADRPRAVSRLPRRRPARARGAPRADRARLERRQRIGARQRPDRSELSFAGRVRRNLQRRRRKLMVIRELHQGVGIRRPCPRAPAASGRRKPISDSRGKIRILLLAKFYPCPCIPAEHARSARAGAQEPHAETNRCRYRRSLRSAAMTENPNRLNFADHPITGSRISPAAFRRRPPCLPSGRGWQRARETRAVRNGCPRRARSRTRG